MSRDHARSARYAQLRLHLGARPAGGGRGGRLVRARSCSAPRTTTSGCGSSRPAAARCSTASRSRSTARRPGSVSSNVARMAVNCQGTYRRALERGRLPARRARIARRELRYNRAMEAAARAWLRPPICAPRAAPSDARLGGGDAAGHWREWAGALRGRRAELRLSLPTGARGDRGRPRRGRRRRSERLAGRRPDHTTAPASRRSRTLSRNAAQLSVIARRHVGRRADHALVAGGQHPHVLAPPRPVDAALAADHADAAPVGAVEEVEVDRRQRAARVAQRQQRHVLDVDLEVGDVLQPAADLDGVAERPRDVVDLVDRVEQDPAAELGARAVRPPVVGARPPARQVRTRTSRAPRGDARSLPRRRSSGRSPGRGGSAGSSRWRRSARPHRRGSTSSSTPSALTASGFSTSTSQPWSSASASCSVWRNDGLATTATSAAASALAASGAVSCRRPARRPRPGPRRPPGSPACTSRPAWRRPIEPWPSTAAVSGWPEVTYAAA